MLPIMYWGDNEEKRKKRLEENLREKRAKRMGEHKVTPPPLPDNASIGDNIAREELNVLIEEQKGDIRNLQHLLIQQGKVLQQILEKQGEVKYEIVNKPSAEEVRLKEKDINIPALGDIDVKIIKTDGFETQGEAGESKKEGESVKDRVAKLKALKLKKGDKK